MSAGYLRIAMPVLALVTSAMLAGCSSSSDLSQTAAIATPAAGTVESSPGAVASAVGPDGQPIAPVQGAPVATTAVQAIPVAMADCDQLKAELTAFKADKTPEKLAQFGQSKYTPTPDESTRFARYVAVNQASKDKCGTVAAVDKKVKVKVKKVEKSAAMAADKEPAAAATVKTKVKKVVVKAKAAGAAVDPLMDPNGESDGGVTTTGTSG